MQRIDGKSCRNESQTTRKISNEDTFSDNDYENIAVNCFRYLNFKTLDEVNRLTIKEYNLHMKAVRLKEVDTEYHIHLLAFNNFRVKAKKKAGRNKTRPVYRTFKKFFDYEQRIQEVLKPMEKTSQFSDASKFIKERREANGGNL